MLELRNISFAVEGEKEIIKNLSMTLEDGKFVVITGPNGGGKSTLARLIAGIAIPDSGQILLDGEDITTLGITQRAQKGISYAFQQPVRFKGMTVRDLLSLAAGRSLDSMEACDYLSQVGLCALEYVEREVNASLSGGELKRIEIATLLARGTKVSIFDEPEAGIDLWSFKNLISIFDTMHTKINGSILIISHQERILEIADEIVVISAGEILNQGPRDEILPTLLAPDGSGVGCPCLNAQ